MMTNILVSVHSTKSTSIKINGTTNFSSQGYVYIYPLYEHVKAEDMLTFCSIQKKTVWTKFQGYFEIYGIL